MTPVPAAKVFLVELIVLFLRERSVSGAADEARSNPSGAGDLKLSMRTIRAVHIHSVLIAARRPGDGNSPVTRDVHGPVEHRVLHHYGKGHNPKRVR